MRRIFKAVNVTAIIYCILLMILISVPAVEISDELIKYSIFFMGILSLISLFFKRMIFKEKSSGIKVVVVYGILAVLICITLAVGAFC